MRSPIPLCGAKKKWKLVKLGLEMIQTVVSEVVMQAQHWAG